MNISDEWANTIHRKYPQKVEGVRSMIWRVGTPMAAVFVVGSLVLDSFWWSVPGIMWLALSTTLFFPILTVALPLALAYSLGGSLYETERWGQSVRKLMALTNGVRRSELAVIVHVGSSPRIRLGMGVWVVPEEGAEPEEILSTFFRGGAAGWRRAAAILQILETMANQFDRVEGYFSLEEREAVLIRTDDPSLRWRVFALQMKRFVSSVEWAKLLSAYVPAACGQPCDTIVQKVSDAVSGSSWRKKTNDQGVGSLRKAYRSQVRARGANTLEERAVELVGMSAKDWLIDRVVRTGNVSVNGSVMQDLESHASFSASWPFVLWFVGIVLGMVGAAIVTAVTQGLVESFVFPEDRFAVSAAIFLLVVLLSAVFWFAMPIIPVWWSSMTRGGGSTRREHAWRLKSLERLRSQGAPSNPVLVVRTERVRQGGGQEESSRWRLGFALFDGHLLSDAPYVIGFFVGDTSANPAWPGLRIIQEVLRRVPWGSWLLYLANVEDGSLASFGDCLRGTDELSNNGVPWELPASCLEDHRPLARAALSVLNSIGGHAGGEIVP